MSAAVDTTEWPIFILSLEGEENRRAPLLSALSDMGFAPQVLIGVDGRKGLPEWAENKILRRRLNPTKRPLTDGEYACALSHVNAYRLIIENTLPGAIIFEDDARIGEYFKKFVEARGYALGDMVLLGHMKCWVKRNNSLEVTPGIHLHRIANTPYLAHAYSVSQIAAQTLLMAATPVREPADWPCDLSRMDVFASDPQLAHQIIKDMNHSSLEADRQELLQQYKTPKLLERCKRILSKRWRYTWWRKWCVRRFNHRLS